MPQRPLKPCKKIGCSNLTRDISGYCEEHKKEAIEREHMRKQRQYKEYDKKRKGEIQWNFYKSAEWERIRQVALARDNYLCQECLKEGRLTVSNTVHHIIEIKTDWSKRLDLDNLVTLCEYHHNKMHGR